MDPLTLNVTSQSDPAVTILQVAGRIDATTASLLRERASQLYAEGARRLLLDLEKVDYISSAGLNTFHMIYKLYTPVEEIKAWEPGGEMYKTPYFKLVCPSPQIYGVLNLAGFLHNIPFFTNLNDALESFK